MIALKYIGIYALAILAAKLLSIFIGKIISTKNAMILIAKYFQFRLLTGIVMPYENIVLPFILLLILELTVILIAMTYGLNSKEEKARQEVVDRIISSMWIFPKGLSDEPKEEIKFKLWGIKVQLYALIIPLFLGALIPLLVFYFYHGIDPSRNFLITISLFIYPAYTFVRRSIIESSNIIRSPDYIEKIKSKKMLDSMLEGMTLAVYLFFMLRCLESLSISLVSSIVIAIPIVIFFLFTLLPYFAGIKSTNRQIRNFVSKRLKILEALSNEIKIMENSNLSENSEAVYIVKTEMEVILNNYHIAESFKYMGEQIVTEYKEQLQKAKNTFMFLHRGEINSLKRQIEHYSESVSYVLPIELLFDLDEYIKLLLQSKQKEDQLFFVNKWVEENKEKLVEIEKPLNLIKVIFSTLFAGFAGFVIKYIYDNFQMIVDLFNN